MDKVRWGVLSTARIGLTKVIPAMQRGRFCRVEAIASRSQEAARKVADDLGIAKVYGSYEALLADPDIDAVYIPLPNHLHVHWAIAALRAGKHVLCEKPVGLNAGEARRLLDEAGKHPGLKIMEGFMYRHHPQWVAAKNIVDEGGVGELRTVQSFFSYYNVAPGNIRNRAEVGGGALMDVGCYGIHLSRLLFGTEPQRVCGFADVDPKFGTDRLFSAMLDFGGRLSTFTCSTQLDRYQRVNILGTVGRVEILIPFNAPPGTPCTIIHQQGGEERQLMFDACDQYTAQGDIFSRAILEGAPVPVSLEDALANMAALDALVRSAEQGVWVEC